MLSSSSMLSTVVLSPSTLSLLRLLGIATLAVAFLYSALSRKANAQMIVICWMLASMAMNVVNKEVAVTFEATCFVVIVQMVFSACLFLVVEGKNMKYGKYQDLIKWSVVPLFFAGMLVTSMWALKELTLSAVLILRNVLPILTLFAEKWLFDSPSRITSAMLFSMLLALVGTVVYGCWNVAVTPSGAAFIGANCILTVVDRLLQRHFLQSPNFTVSLPLCMLVNNVLGLFPILGLAAVTGELYNWGGVAQSASASTWSLLIFSCVCGCCLGYLGLQCQRLVSATTFLMLQNFSKVVLIFVGMSIFGDHMWGTSALGCVLSMLGALWYSFERLPQETNKKLPEPSCTALESKPLVEKCCV